MPDVLAVGEPVPSGVSVTLVTTQGNLAASVVSGTSLASLIVPNVAALGAVNAAPFAQGQAATVQSNGSVWSLNLTGTVLPTDGVTVIAATPAGQWWRTSTNVYLAQWLQQDQWIVDPQNSSGLANDENDGATVLTPLVHGTEIFRRYGYNWGPDLGAQARIDVSVNFLSGSPEDGSDPLCFAPTLINGSTFSIIANLPPAAMTATLTGLVPKSIGIEGGAGALSTSFTPTAGSPAQNMLLVNTTKGNSRAWVQHDLFGGTAWQISQPANPYPGPPTLPDLGASVDTWADGDAVLGFNLINVDIARVAGVQVTIPGTVPSGSNGFFVWQCNVNDPNLSPVGTGANCEFEASVGYACLECSFGNANGSGRSIAAQGNSTFNPVFWNVAGGVDSGSSLLTNFIYIEGAGGVVWFAGLFQGNIIRFATGFFFADVIVNGRFGVRLTNMNTNGNVCVDGTAGTATTYNNQVDCRGIVRTGGHTYYGGEGAKLNSQGAVTYPSGTPGGNTFILGGGITIDNSTSAYSFASTGPGTIATVHLVTLIAGNLDVAAGPIGFGGLAVSGGFSIQQEGVAP